LLPRDLSTTQRYIHSPSAVIDAIRLLEGYGQGAVRGHIVETGALVPNVHRPLPNASRIQC